MAFFLMIASACSSKDGEWKGAVVVFMFYFLPKMSILVRWKVAVGWGPELWAKVTSRQHQRSHRRKQEVLTLQLTKDSLGKTFCHWREFSRGAGHKEITSCSVDSPRSSSVSWPLSQSNSLWDLVFPTQCVLILCVHVLILKPFRVLSTCFKTS